MTDLRSLSRIQGKQPISGRARTALSYTDSSRKNFTIKTKRIEWLKAARERGRQSLLRYLSDGKAPIPMPKSRCRVRGCKTGPLTWGDRSYDFDHKDNNSAHNTQSNCWLVCKVCHGKNTRLKVIQERDVFGGVAGYRTIKLKVGYKKAAAKKRPAKRRRKQTDRLSFF